MTVNRCFWLAIYYGMARHLLGSTSLFGKLLHSKSIRYYCCKHIFKTIGENVNIEKGAWFGRGSLKSGIILVLATMLIFYIIQR